MYKNTRNIGLDILRVCLVLLVWAFHARIHLGCSFGVLNSFVEVGALSMTGFFMLSGFTLYMLYGNDDFADLKYTKRFMVKRLISLWPLYLVCGFVSILLSAIDSGSIKVLVKALFLIPLDLLGVTTVFSSLFFIPPNGGTWFISCMFICYLLFPWISIIVRQLSIRGLLFMMGLAWFLLFFAPIVVRSYHIMDVYSNPFFRFCEFVFGIAIAKLYLAHERVRACVGVGYFLLAAISHIAFVCLFVRLFKVGVGFNAYTFCSAISLPFYAVMIKAAYSMALSQSRLRSVIETCSLWSFPFYLTQWYGFLIVKKLMPQLMDCNIGKMAVSFAFGVLFSILAYKYVQMPLKAYLTFRFCKENKND